MARSMFISKKFSSILSYLALTLLWSFLGISYSYAEDLEKVFLQSQTGALKATPQMDAAPVAQLTRGTELLVLKKEGLWLEIKTSTGQQGWIPKIFTSSIKPMGQSQLLKDTAQLDSNAKTSRRRTTDYAVSAATRGLTSSERHRPGDETFRSDRNAVDALDRVLVNPNQVKQFMLDSGLPL